VPAHQFVPLFSGEIEVQPPTTGLAERVCVVSGGLQLRRMDDSESRFMPGGTFRESWAILPNWKAKGLNYIYGVEDDTVLTGERLSDKFGGSVDYQVSNNNGITWYYWDGFNWALTATEWSTKEMLDTHLISFPLTDQHEIRVKVRLRPGNNGKTTPVLRRLTFFADYTLNLTDDLIRSMKHWLESHIWLKTKNYSDSYNEDIVSIGRGWEELSAPVEVYNTTLDPSKLNNLFTGFVSGGIKLSSRQTGRIDASFLARPPVYVGAEEFMEISSIPSIVVNLQSLREVRNLRHGNSEMDLSIGRRKARIHLAKVWFDAEFRISVQSDLKHEAVTMSDAVNEALTYHQYVLSEQLGETMPVPSSTPFTQAHRVAQGLFVREFVCTVFAKTWLRQDTSVEYDLVEKVVFLPHLMGQEDVSNEIMEVSDV